MNSPERKDIVQSSSINRRQFVQRSAGALAAAGVFCRAKGAWAVDAKPAILGGEPLHSGHWPSWPVTDQAEEEALIKVLRSGRWFRYSGADSVARFEKLWAEATGTLFCQATNGGTSALITALASLGIGPGDEVLIPPYTFIATVNCVLLHHALPVFVDSEPQTAQIDVSKIKDRITGNTKCLLPVHLGGASCDMDRLMEIARQHSLHVIEDSCQTHTGQWNGKALGSFGDAGCFSFQNSKNITCGDGGALITDQEPLYQRAQAFHNNGNGRFAHDGNFTANGGNFRLTEFQGAILIEQLQRLDQQSRRREQNAAYLDTLLEQVGCARPKAKLPGTTRHGYHLYIFDYDPEAVAGMPKSRFCRALEAEGIPVSGGYGPTNKMPWVEQFLQARGFQRIYGKRRLEQWREQNQLPANDRMIETTCWLGQNILLAEKQDMERIAAAIARVQQHADAIKNSE